MSFRIVLRQPVRPGLLPDSQWSAAADAFAAYRRLIRNRVAVEKILDLRTAPHKPITSAELEAIALSERNNRYRAALSL